MLASVADTVAIAILLILIRDRRTIILPIWNPIAIGIYLLGCLNHFIESHFLRLGRALSLGGW